MNHAELANKIDGISVEGADKPEGIERRLAAIEETIREIHALLLDRRPTKDWYTIAEVAEMLSRADFTVREWARNGRIYASKRACGRGPTQEWIISAEEVERIRNEGLLPY